MSEPLRKYDSSAVCSSELLRRANSSPGRCKTGRSNFHSRASARTVALRQAQHNRANERCERRRRSGPEQSCTSALAKRIVNLLRAANLRSLLGKFADSLFACFRAALFAASELFRQLHLTFVAENVRRPCCATAMRFFGKCARANALPPPPVECGAASSDGQLQEGLRVLKLAKQGTGQPRGVCFVCWPPPLTSARLFLSLSITNRPKFFGRPTGYWWWMLLTTRPYWCSAAARIQAHTHTDAGTHTQLPRFEASRQTMSKQQVFLF